MRLTKEKKMVFERLNAVEAELNDLYVFLDDNNCRKLAASVYEALDLVSKIAWTLTPPKERKAAQRFCDELVFPLLENGAKSVEIRNDRIAVNSPVTDESPIFHLA
jgi:hypothetical protein